MVGKEAGRPEGDKRRSETERVAGNE